MSTRSIRWLAGLLLALAVQAPTLAEDTDLFTASNSAASNVLFVFDNAASFSAAAGFCNISADGVVTTSSDTADRTALTRTAGGVEQCAIYSALKALDANTTARFNIAFMMFNGSGLKRYNPTTNSFTSCVGGTGGCLVLQLAEWTPDVKANVLNWIRNWTSSGNSNYNVKVNGLASGAVMQEAYAFFRGKTGISGTVYDLPNIGCGKNAIIYVGNAYQNNTKPFDQTGASGPKQYLLNGSNTATGMYANPAPSTEDKKSYTDTLTARYTIGNTTLTCRSGQNASFTFSDDEGSGSWGLNWAKYLWNRHEIMTSAIGLLSADCLPAYSTWLQRLAEAGAGAFYPANDYATLAAALAGATNNIITANSAFASVSLPVSVNTQGNYLNQVFVGMFRPDKTFLPRWFGNLKQYKLGFTTADTLKLLDAAGAEAINSATGFIKPCVRAFWTPASETGDGYWAAQESGDCTSPNNGPYDTPDGNIVEKGAQAYMLRSLAPDNRVVKTCGETFDSCDATWSNFNPSLATVPEKFGVSTNDDRNTLINWGRGVNTRAEMSKATTVMRPSVHGDVVHSRPVAVNHGTVDAPNVVVYYGANDGLLHAVNGNQTTTITATVSGTSKSWAPGAELWSFMPAEFYGTIKRLYDNAIPVKFRGTVANSAQDKPYGMDGAVVAFKGSIGGASKVYIYSTMRRAGRAVYAFDVTNPASPAMLWKIGCNSVNLSSTDCGGSGGTDNRNYSGIGQTWAAPRVFFARGVDNGATPLLLMGGGYDTCEDYDASGANNNCTTDNKGRRVYVINGRTGEIEGSFPTVSPYGSAPSRGVVSEPTVVSSGGIARYAYISDLGGVVYRLDFTSSSKDNWEMTPIARLGCNDPTTSCSANRKFMFQASVVSTDNVTFQLLLGSGDREKPTLRYPASNAVVNYFFMLKDTPSDSNALRDACGSGRNYICLDSLVPITTDNPSAAALNEKKGWYLALAASEQVVTSAITQFGITTFSTHRPSVLSTTTCSNDLGVSRVYNISYKDAAPANGSSRFEHLSGDGLPPSPVAGTVLIDGKEVPFCIGCSKESPLEGKKATQMSGVARAKSRLYWYVEKN